MTDVSAQNFAPAAARSVPAEAPSVLRRIRAFIVSYQTFRGNCEVLSRMSDRQLDDIGLTRGDIARVSMVEADRMRAMVLAGR